MTDSGWTRTDMRTIVRGPWRIVEARVAGDVVYTLLKDTQELHGRHLVSLRLIRGTSRNSEELKGAADAMDRVRARPLLATKETA